MLSTIMVMVTMIWMASTVNSDDNDDDDDDGGYDDDNVIDVAGVPYRWRRREKYGVWLASSP